MNDSQAGSDHYKRIVLAVIIAPLMLLPISLIATVISNLYAQFAVDSYSRFVRIYSSSDVVVLAYVVAVAALVTLVYGVPVYLVLKRFRLANIYTLSAAGFIVLVPLGGIYFACAGAFVAACFWLIVAPYSQTTRKRNRNIAITIACAAILMLLLANLIEAEYADEIMDYRIGKTIDNTVALPDWWASVAVDENIVDILDARRMRRQIDDYLPGTEERAQQGRTFFKAAFIALRNNKLPAGTAMELVHMMDIPYVDDVHLFELQKYALSIYPTELTTRLLLLQQMLKIYEPGTGGHGYAMSLSYDLITESSGRASATLLASVCRQLANEYDGREINYFEISVFKKCVARLSRHQDEPEMQQSLAEVLKQLEWMEQVLKSQQNAVAQ